MRHHDWVARLWRTVREHERTPFGYGPGEHWCGLFAARCVDAVTGSNWAAEFEGLTRRDAARILLTEGGIEGAVTRRLGSPVEGRATSRGDVCLIGPRRLGVSAGTSVWVLTHDRVEARPLSLVRKHWKVN
jgi:hypothetical protein